MEQKSLEDTLQQLQEEVTMNTKTLKNYEDLLLDQLANTEGSLLENVELIDVLNQIKTKSKEVKYDSSLGKIVEIHKLEDYLENAGITKLG